MSLSLGIKAIFPLSTANRPHILGFTTARTVANDTLAEVWNGSTNSDRRLSLDLNGALKLYGTNSSLLIADGITAPAAVSGYAIIYVDTADGDLKCKFSDGTTKTIVVDT